MTGVDASLTIDGKPNIQSASNTVANLIPGVTFQLLAPSTADEVVRLLSLPDEAGRTDTGAFAGFRPARFGPLAGAGGGALLRR